MRLAMPWSSMSASRKSSHTPYVQRCEPPVVAVGPGGECGIQDWVGGQVDQESDCRSDPFQRAFQSVVAIFLRYSLIRDDRIGFRGCWKWDGRCRVELHRKCARELHRRNPGDADATTTVTRRCDTGGSVTGTIVIDAVWLSRKPVRIPTVRGGTHVSGSSSPGREHPQRARGPTLRCHTQASLHWCNSAGLRKLAAQPQCIPGALRHAVIDGSSTPLRIRCHIIREMRPKCAFPK